MCLFVYDVASCCAHFIYPFPSGVIRLTGSLIQRSAFLPSHSTNNHHCLSIVAQRKPDGYPSLTPEETFRFSVFANHLRFITLLRVIQIYPPMAHLDLTTSLGSISFPFAGVYSRTEMPHDQSTMDILIPSLSPPIHQHTPKVSSISVIRKSVVLVG